MQQQIFLTCSMLSLVLAHCAGSFAIIGADGAAIGSLRLEATLALGAARETAQPLLLQAVVHPPAGLQVQHLTAGRDHCDQARANVVLSRATLRFEAGFSNASKALRTPGIRQSRGARGW